MHHFERRGKKLFLSALQRVKDEKCSLLTIIVRTYAAGRAPNKISLLFHLPQGLIRQNLTH